MKYPLYDCPSGHGFFLITTSKNFVIFYSNLGCHQNVTKPVSLRIMVQIGQIIGVDTGCFRHWYTNFGHTNLGMPKFNLKQN